MDVPACDGARAAHRGDFSRRRRPWPVALAVAEELGASPYPFAMTVALAASAAFVTPASSQVNALVVGPGNYRFSDFVRMGMPFAVITMVACVLLVPLILPFERAECVRQSARPLEPPAAASRRNASPVGCLVPPGDTLF